MCFSCQGQIIVFIFTHLDSRGLETLLNSRHMNLPPGFSTRKASSRAWAGDTHMMDYYYDIIILNITQDLKLLLLVEYILYIRKQKYKENMEH